MSRRLRDVRYARVLVEFFAPSWYEEEDRIQNEKEKIPSPDSKISVVIGIVFGLLVLGSLWFWWTREPSSISTHMTVPFYTSSCFREKEPWENARQLERYLSLHKDYPCFSTINQGHLVPHIALRASEEQPDVIYHIVNPVLIPFEQIYNQGHVYAYPDDQIFKMELDPHAKHKREYRNREQIEMEEPIHALLVGKPHVHQDTSVIETPELPTRHCWRWNAIVVEFEELSFPEGRARAARQTKTFLGDHAMALQHYLDLFYGKDDCLDQKTPVPLYGKLRELVQNEVINKHTIPP